MLKMLINEEEVVSNKDFTIKKEMLNTPSVILNNVYPKTWEEDKDYTSRFYHPNDYSKCKIVDETYIPPEEGTTVTSDTGKIYITDADNTKKDEYQIQGKAEQHSYSGKNYANTNKDPDWKYGNTVWERSGSNVTVKNNGTSTYAFVEYYVDNLKPNTTYTFSFDAVANDNGIINATISYPRATVGVTNIRSLNTAGKTAHLTGQFTTPSDTSGICIIFYSVRGTYHANAKTTYSNIQIEEGSSETSYEPFTNNLPTPNPYYSEEIKTVSGIGNILPNNATTTTINGVTLTVNDDKSITLNGTTTANVYVSLGTINVLNGEILTISGVTGYTSSTLQLFTSSVSAFPVGNRLSCSNGSKTVTAMADENNLDVGVYVYRGNTFNNVTIYPMIEKGSVAHQYVPYGHWLPVKVSNKNLFDEELELGTISSTGVPTSSDSVIRSKNFTKVEEGNVVISYENGPTGIAVYGYDKNYNFITTFPLHTTSTTGLENAMIVNIPENIEYIKFRFNTGFTTTSIKVQIEESSTATDYIEHQEQTTLIDLNKYDENNNIVGNYEICTTLTAPSDNLDVLTIKDGRAVLTKRMGKYVADSNSPFYKTGTYDGLYHLSGVSTPSITYTGYRGICNLFVNNPDTRINSNSPANQYMSDGQFSFRWSTIVANRDRIYFKYLAIPNNVTAFKQLMVDNNFTLYYRQNREDITLRGTYDINLYEGVNHISIVDDDLIPVTTLHYNYVNEQTITDLLFCGVVKNSGNISLNPRYPHYSTLQILDFKNFLSEGELDAFVISNKTILEAIQMVIDSISSYGFVLGNINILNPNEIIGAYSTKDKSAYDVFSYIADITQSRWTTRVIDENTVAIDFYDPSLMEQGTTIEYTQEFFKNNLIDDMDYSYGTNDYRNKQIMTSNQVYSNISQSQSIVANGYQTQFQTEQPLGQIISITSDGKELTFATNNAKELGFTADFYYTPGNNYFESADLRATGEVLNIEYMAIVEGRQIITNPNEIQRVADSTNRKGIVTRYENRNDAITSNELQLIGQSYIKYKGTPEIVLKIKSRSNIWEVGQRVQFNAPIDELNTEYMVRSKEINHIATTDTIFYTYELTSSFNSETAINYFDNQRAKAKGNIGEGEYISRNVDVESTANIIFYDTQATEVTITGDNSLNSVLNAPFIN